MSAKIRMEMPRSEDFVQQEGPNMLIATEDGVIKFTTPFSPTEIEHTNIADVYGEVVRTADRQPLLIKTGGSLRKMNFTLFLGDEANTDVGPKLDTLNELSKSDRALLVYYSNWDGGIKWKITSFAHRDTLHDPLTNQIIRAEVQLEFTEFVTFGSGSGARTGDNPGAPEHEKIGEQSMAEITREYYDDIDLWPKLADFNEILDPRKVPVGYKVKLPKNLNKYFVIPDPPDPDPVPTLSSAG
jgi:hypothetical protein